VPEKTDVSIPRVAIGVATRLPKILVVRCAENVRALRKIKNRRHLLLVLRVPGLPSEISREWESKLNSSLKECGCSLGAKCVFAALGASVVAQSLYSHWGVSLWPIFFVRTLVIVLVAGAVGKLAGQTSARAEFRAIEEKIREFERKSLVGG